MSKHYAEQPDGLSAITFQCCTVQTYTILVSPTELLPLTPWMEFIKTLGLDWPSSCCRELTGSSQNSQRLFPPMKSVMSFQSFWKSILYTEKEMEQKFLIRKRKGDRCQQHTKYKFPISQSTWLSFPRHPQQKTSL